MKWKLSDAKNIHFIENSDFKETVVTLGKFSILLLHGDSFKGQLDKSVREAIARYAIQGIKIDYVMSGAGGQDDAKGNQLDIA